MGHEIEEFGDRASMAYNVDRGVPWHRLGVAMQGLQTAEDMLIAANADYEVRTRPVQVPVDDHDALAIGILQSDLLPQAKLDALNELRVTVENRFATSRINPYNGDLDVFEVMKGRYHVVNNDVVLDRALKVVSASDGQAVVDTVGVLHGGRQFFATIDLGPLVIDPAGVNDKIEKFLVVTSSHDGTVPIVYANTPIRAVCSNTVAMALGNAQSVFKARHTPNVEATLEEAKAILGFSTDWADEFERTAQAMLGINISQTNGRIDKVLDVLWPEALATTDRKARNRQENIDAVRSLFNAQTNGGGFGYNGWSLYNAGVEFFDHYRTGVSDDDRAIQSMDQSSTISGQKVKLQNAVMALAY